MAIETEQIGLLDFLVAPNRRVDPRWKLDFAGDVAHHLDHVRGARGGVVVQIGVLSQNRRNFRHPSSSPATSASRSIILALLWKSLGEFSASAGGCLPGRQPSLRTLDETASTVQCRARCGRRPRRSRRDGTAGSDPLLSLGSEESCRSTSEFTGLRGFSRRSGGMMG